MQHSAVKAFVRMVVDACFLKQTVHVWKHGRDHNVKQVAICNGELCSSTLLAFLIHLAICEKDFCLNGGYCSFSNANCTCSEDWTGHRCSIRVFHAGI